MGLVPYGRDEKELGLMKTMTKEQALAKIDEALLLDDIEWGSEDAVEAANAAVEAAGMLGIDTEAHALDCTSGHLDSRE